MECPKCNSQFNLKNRVPLLLSKCGHTICSYCLNTSIVSGCITCTECGTQTKDIESLNDLPKNLALLEMCRAQEQSICEGEENCPLHNKKLEAFCENDKVLLCIDCILIDGHKFHELYTISESSEKERAKLQDDSDGVTNLKEELSNMLKDINAYKATILDAARKKNEKIEEIYKEIKKIIQERESSLKKSVSALLKKQEDQLEKMQTTITDSINNIDVFLCCVTDYDKENDYKILQKAKDRHKLSCNANKALPNTSFSISFPEVTKEQELVDLWKIFFPTLGNGTIYNTRNSGASSQIGRKVPQTQKNSNRQSPRSKERNSNKLTTITVSDIGSTNPQSRANAGVNNSLLHFGKLKGSPTKSVNNTGNKCQSRRVSINHFKRQLNITSANQTPTSIKNIQNTSITQHNINIFQMQNEVKNVQTRNVAIPNVTFKQILPLRTETNNKKKVSPKKRLKVPKHEIENVEDLADPSTFYEGEKQPPNISKSDLREKKRANMPGADESTKKKLDFSKIERSSLTPNKTSISCIGNMQEPCFSNLTPNNIQVNERKIKSKDNSALILRGDAQSVTIELIPATQNNLHTSNSIDSDVIETSERIQVVKQSPTKVNAKSLSLGINKKKEEQKIKAEVKVIDNEKSINPNENQLKMDARDSVTPSLFDAYLNGPESNRISLTSLALRNTQQIYVFCNKNFLNKNIAGYEELGLLSCEKFDMEKGIWKEITKAPKARSKFAAVVTSPGRIMLLGGKTENGTRTDTMEEYDFVQNQWIDCQIKLLNSKSSFAVAQTLSTISFLLT